MKEFIIQTKIELSDSEIELLKKCKEQGYLEYRDNRTPTLAEFREQGFPQGENWYLLRNEGGTLNLAESLYSKDLLEDYPDAWHLSYQLSKLGEQVLKQISENNS